MTNHYSYKVILSYKGTNYSGWQFQTENLNTVQAQIEKVLASIVNYEKFQLMAASRTDTGVHASGQVLKIVLPKKIDPKNLLKGMNSKLPNDIKILSCEFIKSTFNVNQDVTSKEYHYFFTHNQPENANLADIINYIPTPLNLDLMSKACALIKGEHDFINFCTKGSRELSTVRTISHCSIEKTSLLPFESDVYFLKIKSGGFLKYMVRFIMGSLIKIGQEELTVAEFKLMLKNQEQVFTKKKASAHGLHLIKINYPKT